jgi:hypothetical protein
MRRKMVGSGRPKILDGLALSMLGRRRLRAAVPLVIAGVVLLVYAFTLYPGVAGGDSGEIAAAVATGGVIHPPGYPLYALLGKLFVQLPLGNPAWRLNLLSAVCDAGAASILYLAVAHWSGSLWAGGTTAGLFAFSPVIWRYALCAEVFALNNLLVALLVLLAVLYDDRAELGYALWGAFVFGLGVSNHHTIIFTGAPLLAWAVWRGHRALRVPRDVVILLALFGAGLLPYLYLPIAAAGSSPVSWGASSTWTGFWTHVLRREYGTLHLAVSGIAPAASASATAAAWARDLVESPGAWCLPLGALGVAACARSWRRRPLGLVFLAAPLVSLGVIALLGNLPVYNPLYRWIVARFWQQPDIFVFVLCGLGVAELKRWLPRKVAIAVAVLVSLLSFGMHLRACNRHQSSLVRSYGAEILRAAPPGALLLTRGDLITNTVRYLQAVERQRPDVRVVDEELLGLTWARPKLAAEYPDVAIPAGRYMPGSPDGFAIKELLDANIARAPILVCGGVKQGDTSADSTYGRWPLGLCEIVHVGTEPVNLDDWLSQSQRALPHIDFSGQPRPSGSPEDVVWSDYWEVRQARAAQLLAVAGADPARRKYVGLAAGLLQQIVDDNPEAAPHVYKNLALALGRFGLDTPEERARTAAAWRRYLEVAPTSDPQIPAIERELTRLNDR